MAATTVDEYLTTLPAGLHPVGEALRAVLDTGLAHAEGRIRHGHPVWMIGNRPVAGFRAHRRHVTFLVWHGPRVGTSVKVAGTAQVALAAFTALLAEAETGLLAA